MSYLKGPLSVFESTERCGTKLRDFRTYFTKLDPARMLKAIHQRTTFFLVILILTIHIHYIFIIQGWSNWLQQLSNLTQDYYIHWITNCAVWITTLLAFKIVKERDKTCFFFILPIERRTRKSGGGRGRRTTLEVALGILNLNFHWECI